MRIKMSLIPKQPKEYSQVLLSSSGKWNGPREGRLGWVADEVGEETLLIDGSKGSDRPLDARLAKPSLQPCPQHMTGGYCLEPGIYNTTTRKIMNYVVKWLSVQGDREHRTNQINSSIITIGKESRTYWQNNLASSPAFSMESYTKETKS